MGPARTFTPTPRLLVRSTRTPVYFGVAWDKESPEILNAIAIDVLAYNRVVPSTSRLVVVSSDYGFLETIGAITGVELSSDPSIREKCEIWKLYFLEECPEIPPQGKHVYQKKVGNFGTDRVALRQGQPGYPSLYNPRDNVMVPTGRSPNINRIPPRYYNQYPNMLPSVMPI